MLFYWCGFRNCFFISPSLFIFFVCSPTLFILIHVISVCARHFIFLSTPKILELVLLFLASVKFKILSRLKKKALTHEYSVLCQYSNNQENSISFSLLVSSECWDNKIRFGNLRTPCAALLQFIAFPTATILLISLTLTVSLSLSHSFSPFFRFVMWATQRILLVFGLILACSFYINGKCHKARLISQLFAVCTKYPADWVGVCPAGAHNKIYLEGIQRI